MKTPKKVNSAELLFACCDISEPTWDKMMKGTTKANGSYIRRIIKEHIPGLYESLALDFFNPYEHQSVKKGGLLVYVHSGIEYFIRI